MTTFQERLALGHAFEDEVARQLRARGYAVCPFGQAQMSEEVRKALRDTRSALRWLPDLVAVNPATGIVSLVDAKVDLAGTTSENHCVEQAAFDAHIEMYGLSYIGMSYVFSDGLCCPLRHADRYGKQIESGSVRGSGTPMRLIPKACMFKFDEFFGAKR